MTNFTVIVQDTGVHAALAALAKRVTNMPAVLDTIGTGIIERTKRRFETSTGPDGVAWKPNSTETLAMLSRSIGGQKSKRLKDGGLNAKGRRELANKKPLIGPTRLLSQDIFSLVIGNTLTVSSPFVYSAIHQFGGQAGRGHKVTIPARPFLPIHQDGTLYPNDQAEIFKALNDYLASNL